jgi:murein DD-endopeptidase MepM/ murein hydrolase activator NlpD
MCDKIFVMKKIISTLFVFSFCVSAFAGGGKEKNINSNFDKTTKDTIPYAIDEEELEDYNDSLGTFPAYGLYSGWDTVHTHVSKFNIETLQDDVKEIALYDENSCGYAHPFSGTVTSSFGPRRKRFHYGADIDLETGDAVGAAFDGKVRIARKSKSYGNIIVVRHSNGLETYYAHLSKLNVEVGDEVFAGQTIGLGGNTGHSRGSHLHFEVRYLGQPINPNDIISFSDHKLVADTLCLSKKTFDYIEEAKKMVTSSKGRSHSDSKSKTYVVKKGDTLYAIARKHHTTPQVLCQKNRLKASSSLRLGQRIKL